MPTRKPMPSMLDELLGAKPVSQQSSKPVEQQDSEPVRQQGSEPVKPEATEAAPADMPPIKATYYHTPARVEDLEELRTALRRLVEPDRRASITKSAIVDAALAIVKADFDAHGADSQLARKLVNQ